jgi:hypothetical protein
VKRCPKCAEKIQVKASVCRYCGAEQPKLGKTSNWPILGVSVAVLGVFYLASTIGGKPNPRPVVAESPKPVIPGEKCKGYKGESFNFSGMVKRSLRNPASFEHVLTAYGPVENGVMLATMQYRATNGFGAVDTYVATGEVRVSDCFSRVISAE